MQSTTVVVHLAAVHRTRATEERTLLSEILGLGGVGSVGTLEFATMDRRSFPLSAQESLRCAAGPFPQVRFVSPWFQNSRGRHFRIICAPRNNVLSYERLANALPLVLIHSASKAKLYLEDHAP
jgi:hypothetical protein